jgi:antitoxin (DNA-binding transcriptional repressor) of toxin-antitoxin stability system
MQTLTVTKARAKLGLWMRRAAQGEDIGVIVGAQVIALRPVPITAADYMETEYGLTKAEADRAAAAIRAETRRERAAGRLVPVEDIVASDAPRRSQSPRRRRAAKARAYLKNVR